MSPTAYPQNAAELCDILRSAASHNKTIEILGNGSKRSMGGPVASHDLSISLSGMNRLLSYEPRDLTVSVEAGMPFGELARTLAEHGQMIPLHGAFSSDGTVGGLVAANVFESGRRGYGTARDLVIGLEFATLDGKLVQTGGMVVKNVAGLDMAKLMIGSFGTLAVITRVNFKLLPVSTSSATLLGTFTSHEHAFLAAGRLLSGSLAPAAIDILNPVAAATVGETGFLLAARFGGNSAVVERCRKDSAKLTTGATDIKFINSDRERSFWKVVADLPAAHIRKKPKGVVARVTAPASQTKDVMTGLSVPGHAFAGNGVVRGFFDSLTAAVGWIDGAAARGLHGLIEYSGQDVDRTSTTLYAGRGADIEIMKRIKRAFDPSGILNPGRLYGIV